MEQLSIIEVTGLDDNFDDNSIGGVQMDVTMSEVQDLYRVGWSRVPRRNRRAFKTQYLKLSPTRIVSKFLPLIRYEPFYFNDIGELVIFPVTPHSSSKSSIPRINHYSLLREYFLSALEIDDALNSKPNTPQ